jgi:hypothetical protein
MSDAITSANPRHIIGEDQRFQRQFWLTQRISWIMGLTLVIAACAGLLGSGGWFETVIISSGKHKIEYPRAFRWDADSEIIIKVAPTTGNTVRIELSENFAEDFQLRQAAPMPFVTKMADGRNRYFFPATAGEGGMVILHVRPIRPRIDPSYTIRIGDNPAAQMRPVVWP